MEKLLTVAEIAEGMGVSEETVRRWLRSGKLEGVFLSRKSGWRVRPAALEKFLQEKSERNG